MGKKNPKKKFYYPSKPKKKKANLTQNPNQVKQQPEPVKEMVKEEAEEKEIIVQEETIKEEKEVKEVNTKSETVKSNGIYFSFNMRLIENAIVLFALCIVLGYHISSSFSITSKEIINYKVNSDIDYKVYLKANNFYDTPYLEKGMVYVASLIDNLDIDYRYNFYVDKKSDIDFNYQVKAKLVIASQLNNNIFYEKEYDITEEKTNEIIDQNSYVIAENIKIDYGYYNNLANGFRSAYAVNTNSYLEVYLVVNEKAKESNTYNLENESKVILTVPLSMQELNITLNNKNINEEKELVIEHKEGLNSPYSIAIIVILVLLIVFVGYGLVKKVLILFSNDSKYDSYVKKILNGYDRIIVTVKTLPNFDNYNIIKVADFQELVDVRDNLKTPINYFVITEHHKCEFYVFGTNEVYLYVLKAVDLESDVKDEKKDISK